MEKSGANLSVFHLKLYTVTKQRNAYKQRMVHDIIYAIKKKCISTQCMLGSQPGSNVSTVDDENTTRALAALPHGTKWNVVRVQLNLLPQTRPSHHEQRLGHSTALHGHLSPEAHKNTDI